MKMQLLILFVFLHGLCLGQDPWKNIYSQNAWAARDKWQKADALIRLLKISADSQVADIGCHEGYMTFKLAKVVGANGLVYAVDLDAGKLDKVKKHADELKIVQIKTIKGDDDNPKLPDNVLDAVIILDTYHEMKDHDKILQHIRTSLKPGGHLLICDPIAEERRKDSRADQEKKHELAMEFAIADLKKAGFRIHYQKDPYVDRVKEKGDKMWVIVAVRD